MRNCMMMVGLLFVMPFLVKVLKLHETTIGFLIQLSVVISLIYAIFAPSLYPDFFLAYAIQFMRICEYSTIRALISKTVEHDEIGKVFSGLSILGSTEGFFVGPMYRKLYGATIATFPEAILTLAASCSAAAGIVNLALLTQVKRFRYSFYKKPNK